MVIFPSNVQLEKSFKVNVMHNYKLLKEHTQVMAAKMICKGHTEGLLLIYWILYTESSKREPKWGLGGL